MGDGPIVIVGLHNPQAKYSGTRHNVGAEVVDDLAQRWDIPLKRGPLRVGAEVGRGSVSGVSVVLGLPNASMNVSGPPVKALLKYFKAVPGDLMVCHDDIDLGFGRLRVSHDRGAGGHNGVKSVTAALGTNEFWRLKIGLGRPPGRMDPAAYVLKPFAKVERPEVDLLVSDAAEVAETFLADRERAVQQAGERRIPS